MYWHSVMLDVHLTQEGFLQFSQVFRRSYDVESGSEAVTWVPSVQISPGKLFQTHHPTIEIQKSEFPFQLLLIAPVLHQGRRGCTPFYH